MFNHLHIPQVGAPDPERHNSPVAEETDEEYEVLRREVQGEPVCFFNDRSFSHGTYACSGSTLLRCDYGLWVRMGSCDPDNPRGGEKRRLEPTMLTEPQTGELEKLLERCLVEVPNSIRQVLLETDENYLKYEEHQGALRVRSFA